MAKYPDKLTAGRSKAVPYCPGEPYRARHERRFRVALESRLRLQSWCDQRGLSLRIRNDGEHWIVTREGEQRHLAQWWPRTAKLVLYHRWRSGVHCHDIYQVIDQVSRVIDAKEAPEDQ